MAHFLPTTHEGNQDHRGVLQQRENSHMTVLGGDSSAVGKKRTQSFIDCSGDGGTVEVVEGSRGKRGK